MADGWRGAGEDVLFLTAVGALSQLLAFGYRVILSRVLGAEVMGLYQLIMPVYAVLLSLTAAGPAAAVNNLTSRYLALGNSRGAAAAAGEAGRLFFLLLLPVGTAVVLGSDAISVYALGDARTQLGLILLVPCVALTGIENLHKQQFYAARLVRTPALSDLLEQVVRAGAVLTLLWAFLPQWPERAVGLVVAGMTVCEVCSALLLTLLVRHRRRRTGLQGPGEEPGVCRRRVWSVALPVGGTALLANVLGAANAALIPRKLVERGMTRSRAVAELGVVCGMTGPMLALPTVYLGALSLVLSARVAHSAALGEMEEVRRWIRRAMAVVSLVTLPVMGAMAVLGGDLGRALFRQPGVGRYLLPLAAEMGLGCYEATLLCALNAVGRQGETAAISLVAGAVQVGITLAAVPLVGMGGYVAGALISTALGLGLSLWRVRRHTGLRLQLFCWLTAPALASALGALNANLLYHGLMWRGVDALPAGGAALGAAILLYLAALQAQGVSPRHLLLGEEQ